MVLMAMLVLAYGTPHWSFPGWLWFVAVLHFVSNDDTVNVRLLKGKEKA